MATTHAGGVDRRVSIGRVFSRGFGTITGNPLATLGTAFLFGALPSLLLTAGFETLTPEGLGLGIAIGAFASAVIAIMFFAIAQGALVRPTVAHSRGGTASFGESAMAGLGMALPLFAVAILSAIAIGLGMILFLVPGVMLYCMWAVSAPALVEERLGPIEALGRSRYLTRGARWQVFGLSLVILVGYWMFAGLIGGIGIAVYGMESEAAGLGNLSALRLALEALLQTISSAVWGVLLASLYIELREWKDGPAADALADVFG